MKTALASIPAKNFDGSDTSIDNPVQNVESNAKTTAKDVSHEKEKPSKEAPDKQKPVHNEQTNPNDAQQPIDENEPIEEINKELEKITKLDKKFPQGELQCFKNENRYKWKVKEENGIRYLPKTERNQAEILALKKYYEYRKKELESEAAGWEAYLKKTDKIKINSEHLLNHPEYGKLLAKNFRPLDKELERWQEEPYEKCTKHPENLLVQGTHGKMLRSKSEAIIDRALYQNKIPFHYEEKLILDGIMLYPDFVMRHPFTGQYFYWEHFGMMDNPDYCNHACDKIKLYCRHGIIPSVNLILTYETKQCPLNADKVEMILQEYFGCSKWDAVVG